MEVQPTLAAGTGILTVSLRFRVFYDSGALIRIADAGLHRASNRLPASMRIGIGVSSSAQAPDAQEPAQRDSMKRFSDRRLQRHA